MNTRTVLLGAIATLAALPLTKAASIDQATLTEVVNSVSIIEPASKKTSAARVQQVFNAPNVLRTGADSRAEMVSPDQTVTRVGQSTLFSFEPNSREIQLQKGSILFQSPSGKGGGNIRTPAASAAVLGTTLIVTTTKNGGFKVLLVEGKGRVKAADGTVRILKGGQMVYALPGGRLSGILEFRLSQQVSASRLLGGFKKQLPSAAKIQAAIDKQEKDIASGKAQGTNLLASGTPNFALRVDVARDTVIQDSLVEEEPVDPLTAAATSDAIIDAPSLEEGRLFADDRLNGAGPGAVFTANFGDDDFVAKRAVRPATFLANNITFDTPSVPLFQAAGADVFQFLAINDIHFAQSVDLSSFNGEELQILAGRTITAEPNTVISADAPQFSIIALGSTFPLDGTIPDSLDDFSEEVPLELADVTLENKGGSLSVIGGAMLLERVPILAHKIARVTAAGDLKIDGGTAEPTFDVDFVETPPPASLVPIQGGEEVRIKGLKNVAIRGANIQAPKVRITSEAVLKLTAVQISDGTAAPQPDGDGGVLNPPVFGEQPTVYVFAKEMADLKKINFFANDVLIQSNTIRLENVRFRDGSRVLLESRIGILADNPNTGAPVQAGKVNFVRNVNYGNTPAHNTSVLQQNGPAPTPSGPGVFVRPFQGRLPN